jgi:hypothetical protein
LRISKAGANAPAFFMPEKIAPGGKSCLRARSGLGKNIMKTNGLHS